MDAPHLRRLGEAAIGAGQHIVAPDHPGQTHEPLRDEFWVLDDVRRMR